MKKKILLLAGMAAMLAFGSDAFAINADATATIGSSLSVSVDASGDGAGKLVFGYIIPSGTNGTVTVGPTSADNGSSNVTLTSAIPRSPAKFSVLGSDNSSYTVTVPDNDDVKLKKGGVSSSDDMQVHHFTTSFGATNVGVLVAGVGSFTVGATLDVAATQPSGVYTSTFPVTVAYN